MLSITSSRNALLLELIFLISIVFLSFASALCRKAVILTGARSILFELNKDTWINLEAVIRIGGNVGNTWTICAPPRWERSLLSVGSIECLQITALPSCRISCLTDPDLGTPFSFPIREQVPGALVCL